MGYRTFLTTKTEVKNNLPQIMSAFFLTQFAFIACHVEGYRNILKLSCRPLDFTSYKAFLKIEKRLWN